MFKNLMKYKNFKKMYLSKDNNYSIKRNVFILQKKKLNLSKLKN